MLYVNYQPQDIYVAPVLKDGRTPWVPCYSRQRGMLRCALIVANSRFLILPGVRVPHLASHALSLALRGLKIRLAAALRLRSHRGRDICGAAVAGKLLPRG